MEIVNNARKDGCGHPNIIVMPDISELSDPRGVGAVYYQAMTKYRERVAQIDGHTGEKETYGSLLKRSIRTAITMHNQGIQVGDFVSLCSKSSLDTSVPCIASMFIGAIMSAVDSTMSVQEIVYLLKQVSPKMIFVSKEAVGLMEEVVYALGTKITLVVFGETTEHTPFTDFLTVDPSENQFRPREVENLDETVFMGFSSGTTGRPKGVCHGHRAMLSSTAWFKQKENATVAMFGSLYWSLLHMMLYETTINGFTRLIFDNFDIGDPWKILNYSIDFAFLTPNQIRAFLRYNRPHNLDLENLKTVFVGGYGSSEKQMLELRYLLHKTSIYNCYGQTEIFGSIFKFGSNFRCEDIAIKFPNCVGLPINGFCYKIVDLKTGNILGPNQQGELRLKTRCLTTGYYIRDSSEMYDSDGWFRTGDLGYYNDDGCFFITERIRENFKYLCHHIVPNEIEGVILTHPSIKSAIVIGLPHETDNNHPMAVVELNDEEKQVTSEEIVKYVEERVEDKKRLRGGLKIIKCMPRTVSNKVNRFKIKQMIKSNQI